MISTELFRVLVNDREREIESRLRVRALLGRWRPARTRIAALGHDRAR
jgi:hypothetical protein